MDFDHLPGKQKKFYVSQSMQRPKELILKEIAKCELVCANCHRNRTQERKKELR
jgi:hypothetical protein